jgi:hypothetical protein
MITSPSVAIRYRLEAYFGALVRQAADTDIEGIMSAVAPAVTHLFEETPQPLHGLLERELRTVGDEYGISDELEQVFLEVHEEIDEPGEE